MNGVRVGSGVLHLHREVHVRLGALRQDEDHLRITLR